MDIETLQTLSTVFFTLSGVLLLIAIILFFVFEIPKTLGFVTGISAAKEIKAFQDKVQRETEISQTGKIGETAQISTGNPVTENQTVILDSSEIPISNTEEEALPVENSDTIFTVIQEMSFTSSIEIID